ncbi:hypothetical protein QOZ80_6AG0545390 [Eleusine coracana subsp. coracana]|nr:hypothetical protein QOZ80_6AG0545390 [Eleusine coracana subsp. coracana]
MGSGLSSDHRGIRSSLHQPPPARVIGVDGSLREFQAAASPPASVSDVLGGGDNAGRFFVCSSDALYFDADVPALGADELLRPGQIYFVLPVAMLGRPLSAADMAALAVRATEAMAARSRGRAGGFTKVRVVPVRADGDGEINEKLNQRTLGEFLMNSMRNAKKLTVVARPPIRRALSAIAEDA